MIDMLNGSGNGTVIKLLWMVAVYIFLISLEMEKAFFPVHSGSSAAPGSTGYQAQVPGGRGIYEDVQDARYPNGMSLDYGRKPTQRTENMRTAHKQGMGGNPSPDRGDGRLHAVLFSVGRKQKQL